MQLFRAMETSSSALTAGRLHMDLIAHNLANINTTRGADGQPYRRRYAIQEERSHGFQGMLDQRIRGAGARPRAGAGADTAAGAEAATGAGVRVAAILEDQSPYKLKHDPTHPDADADGMVRMPNVDLLQEISDMMMATRFYEANVTALNAGKGLALKALEIGR